MATGNLKPYNAEKSARKNDSDQTTYKVIGLWIAVVVIVLVAFAKASLWGGVIGLAIWAGSWYVYTKKISRILVVVIGFVLAIVAVMLSSNYIG